MLLVKQNDFAWPQTPPEARKYRREHQRIVEATAAKQHQHARLARLSATRSQLGQKRQIGVRGDEGAPACLRRSSHRRMVWCGSCTLRSAMGRAAEQSVGKGILSRWSR